MALAGIHMSDVPSFPYELLWRERTVRSVANMTRRDAEEFMALAADAGVRTEVEEFALDRRQRGARGRRRRSGARRGGAADQVEAA